MVSLGSRLRWVSLDVREVTPLGGIFKWLILAKKHKMKPTGGLLENLLLLELKKDKGAGGEEWNGRRRRKQSNRKFFSLTVCDFLLLQWIVYICSTWRHCSRPATMKVKWAEWQKYTSNALTLHCLEKQNKTNKQQQQQTSPTMTPVSPFIMLNWIQNHEASFSPMSIQTSFPHLVGAKISQKYKIVQGIHWNYKRL